MRALVSQGAPSALPFFGLALSFAVRRRPETGGRRDCRSPRHRGSPTPPGRRRSGHGPGAER
ncbi:MAG: hypothetical protein DI624_07770 [Brevundimonas sp.]|nr:MAG: hypothetical protein DI624_07770 [Brevundimonas sp.]